MVKLILPKISVGNIILQTFLCLKDFTYKATYSIPLRFEWQQSDPHLLLYMSVDWRKIAINQLAYKTKWDSHEIKAFCILVVKTFLASECFKYQRFDGSRFHNKFL